MKYTFVSLSKLEKLGVLLNAYYLADFMFLWVSFLGKMPTIWFTWPYSTKIAFRDSKFKGEVNYNDNLPSQIIKLLKDD
jgi:hypothetical protein